MPKKIRNPKFACGTQNGTKIDSHWNMPLEVCNKFILIEIKCNKAEDDLIGCYMRSCGIPHDHDYSQSS